jgi:hypothetical protein
MTQGLWRGPVIKEGLRFWIRRDVPSYGPVLGSGGSTVSDLQAASILYVDVQLLMPLLPDSNHFYAASA